MKKSVLIIDDDVDICTLLQRYLTKKGFKTDISFSAKNAFNKLGGNKYDIVFCDFRLGDKDGFDVLTEIKMNHSHTEVIIITGYSDVKTAVSLIKSGAFDYITKPLVPEELIKTINRALNNQKQNEDQPSLNKTASKKPASQVLSKKVFEGSSPEIKRLYHQVSIVAPTDYSIILHGESGSGKEVIAKTIHQTSSRSSGPFVALDCGTLSKELANSELFGHMKGAFTGAITDKKGHFEMANGGTLFLDEVANLSYDIQAALLRVIQERKMKRIGGTKEMTLDVRIIVASHEDLRKAYQEKLFREDLYHRLNEFSIEIPPLRRRREDIPGFAHFFLHLTNEETGKQIEGFEDDVMERFIEYDWPGNIRELRNTIRKAILLTSSGKVTKKVLSSGLLHIPLSSVQPPGTEIEPVEDPPKDLKRVSLEVEYQAIVEVLKSVNFNKSKAAKILKIDRKTLYNKIKEHGA